MKAVTMSNNALSKSGKPWYTFPLVWLLIAIPFSAVIMGVIMIWMAVDTDDGLVVDDYYKQGLEINRVIERDIRAAELRISAVVDFDNSKKIIRMKFDKGLLENYPDSLQLRLQHATRENSDVSVEMSHGIGNQYIGHLATPITEGVWYFNLAGTNHDGAGWKVDARMHVQSHSIIRLQSDYEVSD
jgi:hypothetical protein